MWALSMSRNKKVDMSPNRSPHNSASGTLQKALPQALCFQTSKPSAMCTGHPLQPPLDTGKDRQGQFQIRPTALQCKKTENCLHLFEADAQACQYCPGYATLGERRSPAEPCRGRVTAGRGTICTRKAFLWGPAGGGRGAPAESGCQELL